MRGKFRLLAGCAMAVWAGLLGNGNLQAQVVVVGGVRPLRTWVSPPVYYAASPIVYAAPMVVVPSPATSSVVAPSLYWTPVPQVTTGIVPSSAVMMTPAITAVPVYRPVMVAPVRYGPLRLRRGVAIW